MGGGFFLEHWGLVIGKPAQQRVLIPTWMLPELLACQSLHHTPPWCRGKWVVGVGPLITSSRDHKPPWGMCKATLFSSMEKKNYLLFFSHPGWTTAFLHWEGNTHITTMCLPLQVKQRGLYSVHLYTPKRLYLSFFFLPRCTKISVLVLCYQRHNLEILLHVSTHRL